MAQSINTNVASLNAQRNLNSSQLSLSTSLQRLSSGLRVNSAKDDAAGLAISERMSGQVRGMTAAMRNANDAISMAQTAEGALGSMGEIMQRMRELAVQASTGSVSTADRTSLNGEYTTLEEELLRIADVTEFNGTKLLAAALTVSFQVGANTAAENQIDVTGTDVKAAITTLNAGGVAGADGTNALAAIDLLDTAIDVITTERATWGAVQNRFQATISNLSVAIENTSAARGRIIDADFASESANLTRGQILQQAGTAMLAQANALPQNVLTLLRG